MLRPLSHYLQEYARARKRTIDHDRDRKHKNRHSASFFVNTLSTCQNEPPSPQQRGRYRPASVIGLVHAGIPAFPGLSSSTRSNHPSPLSCFFPFLPFTHNTSDSVSSDNEESDVESDHSLDYDSEEQARMTPSKEKKPLPSSKSFVINIRPKTHKEWRDALDKVKGLFFENQLKECVARCEILLASPEVPVSLLFVYDYRDPTYALLAASIA